MRQLALNHAELEAMQLLGLAARAAEIRRRTGYAITPWQLRRLYHDHDIRFRRTQQAYVSEQTNWAPGVLDAWRAEYARGLLELQAEWPEGVVYLDEAA